MSIPVTIADLAKTLADHPVGYLLSTSADGRVKAVTVEPTIDAEVLRVTGPGRGSCVNLAANPAATLLFPPVQPRGYTLLVDGAATVVGEDVHVTAASAVLHRPAAHSDDPGATAAAGGCGHDCEPIR